MTESYVYAITDGTSIKIGVARNPYRRLKALSTGNAKRLILLGYFSGGFELEGILHKRHRKVRDNGEWMHPSPELIDYLNEQINDRHISLDANGNVISHWKIPNGA